MKETKETRLLFSAIFEKYDNSSCPTKTYFTDVRSREGGVVKNHLVFDEQISSTIPKKLILGDYVSFLADIEFKNVQFLNIFELDGVSV